MPSPQNLSESEAFRAGLIKNGETWMEMINSRNQTTHTYNEETVEEIKKAILSSYYFEFEALQTTFEELRRKEQS